MSDQNEVSAETPVGKFRFAGRDIMVLLIIALTGVLVWLAFDVHAHKMEARDSWGTIRDLMREMVSSQKEQTCLLAQPPEKREREYMQENSFCKRISR